MWASEQVYRVAVSVSVMNLTDDCPWMKRNELNWMSWDGWSSDPLKYLLKYSNWHNYPLTTSFDTWLLCGTISLRLCWGVYIHNEYSLSHPLFPNYRVELETPKPVQFRERSLDCQLQLTNYYSWVSQSLVGTNLNSDSDSVRRRSTATRRSEMQMSSMFVTNQTTSGLAEIYMVELCSWSHRYRWDKLIKIQIYLIN